MYLCQHKYSLYIISKTKLLGVKPSTFSLEQNHKLLNDDGDIMDGPHRYHHLIWRLIFLSTTTPEIIYVIHVLSQFMNNPNEFYWETALYVVISWKTARVKGFYFKQTQNCYSQLVWFRLGSMSKQVCMTTIYSQEFSSLSLFGLSREIFELNFKKKKTI